MRGHGDGCTSGHGICGNARFAPRSMAYTAVFMVGRCRVDPGLTAVDPALAFRDFQLLKLKYDRLLSNFAFNRNLRHCMMATGFAAATVFNTNAALAVAPTSAIGSMALPAAHTLAHWGIIIAGSVAAFAGLGRAVQLDSIQVSQPVLIAPLGTFGFSA